MNKPDCPNPNTLQAWIDGELQQPDLAAHVSRCQSCRDALSRIESENRLFRSFVDDLSPGPDLTNRIMGSLKTKEPGLNHLETVLLYLFISALSFALSLIYHYLPGLITAPTWQLMFIKLLSAIAGLLSWGYASLMFLWGNVLSATPLLPSLIITLPVICINLYYKRRVLNV